MFRDEYRDTVWTQIRQRDLRAFRNLLTEDLLGEAARRSGTRIGCGALNAVNLVWLAMAAAWQNTRSFADVLCGTLKVLDDLANVGFPGPKTNRNSRTVSRKSRKNRSRHAPRRLDSPHVTEEAWVKARRLMPGNYWVALFALLGERFERRHRRRIRWKHFRLLALDGTSINLPSDTRLAAHFGTAKNGKSKGRIQGRLVMLQFPRVRMPWRYELCPLADGERTVAERLLGHLRPRDLVLMDQGFWSYGLFWQIQRRQAFFAIRLHPQVRPRTVKSLGLGDRRVVWRKPTGPRWRGDAWPPELKLRILDYRIPGFRPSAVVTNVLDPRVISRDEWVRLATGRDTGRPWEPGLYHRRWEIETTFHELKVRQGLEGSLRSRTPPGIVYEVAGHVLLYLLVRWLMVEAALAAGEDPLRLSFQHALQELLDFRPFLLAAETRAARRRLVSRLLARIAAHVVPHRPGRHFPRPHDTQIKNCGHGNFKHPHKLVA